MYMYFLLHIYLYLYIWVLLLALLFFYRLFRFVGLAYIVLVRGPTQHNRGASFDSDDPDIGASILIRDGEQWRDARGD